MGTEEPDFTKEVTLFNDALRELFEYFGDNPLEKDREMTVAAACTYEIVPYSVSEAFLEIMPNADLPVISYCPLGTSWNHGEGNIPQIHIRGRDMWIVNDLTKCLIKAGLEPDVHLTENGTRYHIDAFLGE